MVAITAATNVTVRITGQGVPGPSGATAVHAATHSAGAADPISVENLATAGGVGAVPTSDGAGALTMQVPAGGGNVTSPGGESAGNLTEFTGPNAIGETTLPTATVLAHISDESDPHSTIPPHLIAADPHTQYQLRTEKNAVSGYAGLDAGTKVLGTQIPYGTIVNTATQGNDTRVPSQGENDALVGTDGTPATGNKYVTNSDARNTDARAPTGAAGGDLAGTYASPSVAAVTTTTGPTSLVIGAVAEGEVLTRSGSTLIGTTPGGGGDVVGPASAVDNNLCAFDSTTGKLIKDSGVLTASIELLANKNAASGYAGLSAGSKLTGSQQVYGTAVDTAVQGNDARVPSQTENNALVGTSGTPDTGNAFVTNADSRNSDARAPTGSAGGDLAGTYASPSVAAVTTTTGPTSLVIGAVADGQFLTRSGSTLIGSTPGGSGDVVGPASSVDDRLCTFDSTSGKLIQDSGALIGQVPSQTENNALVGTDGTPDTGNAYVTNSDARNTNARVPSGSAGGDLAGTYSSPSVAALTTTTGPTSLVIGAVADGELLQRSGSTVIGVAASGGGDFSGPGSSTTDNLVSFANGTGKLGKDSGILASDIFQSINRNSKTGLTVDYTNILIINGGDSAKFDLAAGKGHIYDSTVDPDSPTRVDLEWTPFLAQTVPNIATDDFSTVYIEDTGGEVAGIFINNELPTPELKRSKILIGILGHTDNVSISQAAPRPVMGMDTGACLDDFLDANGDFNVSGNQFTANGANLLLDRSAGVSFGRSISSALDNPHNKSTGLVAPINNYLYSIRDGVTGDFDLAFETELQPQNFDNNGVLTAVGNNDYSIQRILWDPRSEVNLFEYGQTTYNTLNEAISAITENGIIVNPEFAQTVLRGWLVCRNNVTDLAAAIGGTTAVIREAVTGVSQPAGAGFDTNAIHVNQVAEISTIAAKTVPIGTDIIVIEDAAASFAKKKLELGDLVTTLAGPDADTRIATHNADASAHTAMSRTDGTRAFTGVVAGITPVGAADLSTMGYVDGQDSAHDTTAGAHTNRTMTGDLSGTLGAAVVSAVTTTTGPTSLVLGAVADGNVLVRSGSTLIGATPGLAGDVVGPGSAVDDRLCTFDGTTGKLIQDSGVLTASLELLANKNAASGYAGLTAGSKLTGSQQVYGTASDTATQGNDSRVPSQTENNALVGTSGTPDTGNAYVTNADSRNSDARAPTGSAGGDLAGTYSSPSVAALTTTTGPTSLVIGAVADGQSLVRSGSTIVGAAPGLAGDVVGPAVAVDNRLCTFDSTTGKLIKDSGVLVASVELLANKNAASGYAGLTAGSKLTGSQQVYGTASDTATQGNDARVPSQTENNALVGTSGTPDTGNAFVTNADARNSDARVPTGSAGGDLGGTYSSPSVAALTTTTGPTSLVIGAVADGQLLQRSGATLIGVAAAGTGDVVGPASAVNTNLCSFNTTTGKLIQDSGVLTADVFLRDGTVTVTGTVNAGDNEIINVKGAKINDVFNHGNQAAAVPFNFDTNGHVQEVTLTGNAVMTMSGTGVRTGLVLRIKQDATGTRIPTFSTNVHLTNSGVAPSWSPDNTTVDILSGWTDGTTYYLFFGGLLKQNV